MRWPYIISIIALLGAGLLTFFNMLNGASTSTPLGKWYWLQADTSNIPGAHPVTRWTSYNSCGVQDGNNVDCSSSTPGYPVSPVLNFGTEEGVPPQLSSAKGSVYYLTKVGWAFLLIALFFILLAIIPTIVSLFLPSVRVLTGITGLAAIVALLFSILASSLLTAGYVKGRDAFSNEGNATKLNTTQFAFLWTTVVLLFITSFSSGFGFFGNLHKNRSQRYSDNDGGDQSSHETYGNNDVHEKAEGQKKRTRIGFFGRKKAKNPDVTGANQNLGTNAVLGAPGTIPSASTNVTSPTAEAGTTG